MGHRPCLGALRLRVPGNRGGSWGSRQAKRGAGVASGSWIASSLLAKCLQGLCVSPQCPSKARCSGGSSIMGRLFMGTRAPSGLEAQGSALSVRSTSHRAEASLLPALGSSHQPQCRGQDRCSGSFTGAGDSGPIGERPKLGSGALGAAEQRAALRCGHWGLFWGLRRCYRVTCLACFPISSDRRPPMRAQQAARAACAAAARLLAGHFAAPLDWMQQPLS